MSSDTPSTVPSPPSPPDLELVRWGLRFSDAATERAYVHWHALQAIPFTRIGMAISSRPASRTT